MTWPTSELAPLPVKTVNPSVTVKGRSSVVYDVVGVPLLVLADATAAVDVSLASAQSAHVANYCSSNVKHTQRGRRFVCSMQPEQYDRRRCKPHLRQRPQQERRHQHSAVWLRELGVTNVLMMANNKHGETSDCLGLSDQK